jgi:hypothetical protein
LKEFDNFNKAWINFQKIYIRVKSKNIENSEKIQQIVNELKVVQKVLNEVETAVDFTLTRRKYLISRDYQEWAKNWIGEFKRIKSWLDGEINILVRKTPEDKKTPATTAVPGEADTELKKIAERWWIHSEAIKETFKQKNILGMVHGLQKYYTKDVVNYLNNLEKISKQIIQHLDLVISTGRNPEFFKNNFEYMWRTTNLRALVEEIENLEEMIKPFDNIISTEIKARGTEKHGDIIFLNRLHKAYENVIKMENVQDLKALLHTTIPIIEKQVKVK